MWAWGSSLISTPGETFELDFYGNVANDGEGETFLGSTSVVTDGTTGLVNFTNVAIPLTVSAGQFITATATNTAGNTSEFSTSVTAAAASEPPADLPVVNNQTGQQHCKPSAIIKPRLF